MLGSPDDGHCILTIIVIITAAVAGAALLPTPLQLATPTVALVWLMMRFVEAFI